MTTELEQIKRRRLKLGLNQKELAQKANVSQSLIAKIESGKIDPSFTKAKQVFSALEEGESQEEIKAERIMNRKIIFGKSNDSVKEIIQKMKSKGISQIPILRKENVCGLITEATILQKVASEPEKINYLRAEEIMEEAPPLVSPKTGIKTLLELLKDNPVILVSEKGHIKGIISKADLLGKI